MLIRFMTLNEEVGELECLQCEVVKKYAEYIRGLKEVEIIVIGDIDYELENIEFVVSRCGCCSTRIDVYVDEV